MKGTPTGIKREDLYGRQAVLYGGERATVVKAIDTGPEVELLLGFGDREVWLSGYFDDNDEFIDFDSRLR